MISLYCKNAAGEIVLLKRGVTEAEAVALSDAYYEKTGRSTFIVEARPEGGGTDANSD